MSQRPPASRPASRSPPGGQRITLAPVLLRDDPQPGGRQLGRQQAEQPEPRGYPPIQPEPRARTPQAGTPTEDWRSGPSRDLGVHSILNPTEPEGTPSSSSRRISSGNTESPLSAVGPASHFAPSPSTNTSHTFPGQPSSSNPSPTQEGYRTAFSRGRGEHARSPRRILTPKSRAASIRRGSQGTIDAQQSPFLASRGRQYIAGPGQTGSSEIPPMPTPPGQPQQQQYGFPAPETTSSIGRRTSGTMQAPGRTPLSQSASPSISASSANPSSPATFPYKGAPSQTGGSYFPGQSFAAPTQQGHGGGGVQFQAPAASGTEGPYSAPPSSAPSSTSASASSSRQTSDPIQVLTITTSQGIYNVPVDVHQASRLADEKRARNAGASARFRQRRKEKEKEASTTIEKMQQQTRELERKIMEVEQERDFYRGERDRFRDVVYRTPETRHLAIQAPPSPQSVRTGSFQGSMSQIGGPPPPGPPQMGFQPQEPTLERAPRRRRTDTSGEFSTVPYTLPPASTLAPVLAPGYPSQGPTTLAPLRIDNPNAQQASPPHIAAVTSGPPPGFDQYPRGPYDRNWPSEGGRR